MGKKRIILLFLAALLLSWGWSSLFAEEKYQYALDPKDKVYFGHISFSEIKDDADDPLVLGVGDIVPAKAVLNYPIGPGDTVQTSTRRCEIQFDTGTLIRLDSGTELKVETIMAPSLVSNKKLTNLILNRGRIYIMYKRYSRPEIFQIKTESAAVKLNHNSVALMAHKEEGDTDIQMKEGKAEILFGPTWIETKKVKVKKSMRMVISKDQELKAIGGRISTDFELWNQEMNADFVEIHEGRTPIPKPIRRLPKAVVYFAQKFSNIYGEWTWHDHLGYVWRPFYNDHYPWGGWKPYFYGQWRELNGEMFWIPREKWGWVPYHLGLWTWDKDKGWLWIPGSAFAPAWVAWNFFFDGQYLSWRPLGLLDWWPHYYSSGLYEIYGDFGYGRAYNRGGWPENGQGTRTDLTKIRKDQLKRPPQNPYQLPKNLKDAYTKMVHAVNLRNQQVRDSLRQRPEQTRIIPKERLDAARVDQYLMKMTEIAPSEKNPGKSPAGNPRDHAARVYQDNRLSRFFRKSPDLKMRDSMGEAVSRFQPSSLKSRAFVAPLDSSQKEPRTRKGFNQKLGTPYLVTAAPSFFRDWNPDIEVACRGGVTIHYNSRSNEVRCPELGARSGNRKSRSSFRSQTASFGGGGSFSSGGGGGSGSSGSGGSRGSSGGSRGSGSGRGGSSGGRGGKRVPAVSLP